MNAPNPPLKDCGQCSAQVFCKQFGAEKADDLPFDIHQLSQQHGKHYVAVAKWLGITHQGIIYIPITEEVEIRKLREAIQRSPFDLEAVCQAVFAGDPRLEFVLMQLRGEAPWQRQQENAQSAPTPEPQPVEQHQFCQREDNTLTLRLWQFEMNAITDAMTELHIHPENGRFGRGQLYAILNVSRIWQTPGHPGWLQLMEALGQDDTAIFTVIFEVQPLVFRADVEAFVDARLATMQHGFDQVLDSMIDQANDALTDKSFELHMLGQRCDRLELQLRALQTRLAEVKEELEHRTWRYRIRNWWQTSWFSPALYYEIVKCLTRRHKAIRFLKQHAEINLANYEGIGVIMQAALGTSVPDHEWHQIFPTPSQRFRTWLESWLKLLQEPETWVALTTVNIWRYLITHRNITPFQLVSVLSLYGCEDGYTVYVCEDENCTCHTEERMVNDFLAWNRNHAPFWRWNIFTREFWRDGGVIQYREHGGKWRMATKLWKPDAWKSFYSWSRSAYFGIATFIISLFLLYSGLVSLIGDITKAQEWPIWARILTAIPSFGVGLWVYVNLIEKIRLYAAWRNRQVRIHEERDHTE